MVSQIELDDINFKLKEKYGLSHDHPRFRLVFADKQFTKRRGVYRDFLEGTNILLREVEEVRHVYKYETWNGYFILEGYNEWGSHPPDEYDYNGYECLYVFKKKDGSPQDVVAWKPIDFLCAGIMARREGKSEHKTRKDFIRDYIAAGEKEKQIFFEILDNEAPYVPGLLADKGGSAVVNPGIESQIEPEPLKD